MKSLLLLAALTLGAFLLGALSVVLWTNRTGSAASAPPPDTENPDKEAKPSPTPPTPEGKVVKREEIKSPAPPPKKVGDPERIRQNLKPGKTYVTHCSGTLNVRGEDTSWGLGRVVTINYAFEAQIDREIESNDGKLIVELRRFRDVRSVKVSSRLEDVRLELGERPGWLLTLLGKAHPKVAILATVVQALDGVSTKPLLEGLRWAGVAPERMAGLDTSDVKMAAQINELSGKAVRLSFLDGAGVVKVEAVRGNMTRTERNFHFATSVLSDSLIFPDTQVRTGVQWTVDGSNFANLLDPAMLAKTSGEVVLERAADRLIAGKECRHLRVVEGRITLESNEEDSKNEQMGHFDPHGSFFFSPEDQIVIEARLKGRAKLERFSKDHLLFETRMRREPQLDIRYTCKVTDTRKEK
jgi:hypothetical protein